ncbi:MAG: PKD domain-containing protein [Bacteroidota bacterium]
MKNNINLFVQSLKVVFLMGLLLSFQSCEDSFKFDLPEANSKEDTVLPTADFSYISNADDFRTIEFTNLSFESTRYSWDFGGGNVSDEQDPVFTFTDGEGIYPVTLTASDENGASDAITIDVEVKDAFVAITPEILNGNFDDGQDDWKFSTFTGGTTSPFNSSSDGSPLNYDGTDSGSTKTPGAKWTMSTSAGVYVSSNTRYAYQAIVVSPNVEYILEYEYSIKNDGTVAEGGNRIIGGILNGHFDDGAEAIGSVDSEPLLVMNVGTEDLGKGTFTTVRAEFTSNSTGEVAILIYGVTDVDAYVDNVKVYPKE